MPRLRVVTWNVHRCRGLDGRVRPERIARVLRRLQPDVVAMQEVLSRCDRNHHDDQASFVAHALGVEARCGVNLSRGPWHYGNVVLTRLPAGEGRNYDMSVNGYERRGCLRVDVSVAGHRVHVFNAHLGTSFAERHAQSRLLQQAGILAQGALPGSRLLVGDFNEWAAGSLSRLLHSRLRRARLRGLWQWTYPGLLPLVSIDHVWYDGRLRLLSLRAVRTPLALLASDHVPIVADFEVRPGNGDHGPAQTG